MVYTVFNNSNDESLPARHLSISQDDKQALSGDTTTVVLEPLGQLFDEKRKSLQSKPYYDCFCPNGRKNWIHFTGCPGSINDNRGAGIKDREVILRHLMWFADELCANIALKCTPEVWLSEEHGCHAPRDATWDSYFTPVRNIRVTTNGLDDMLVPQKVNILHWDVNENNSFEGLTRIDGNASIQGYEMGRKLHSEGTPFVWNFNRDFRGTDLFNKQHIWPNQVHNHREYTDSCGIVDLDTSEELLNIGQLMLKELNIKDSQEFVTLHLRRGDAMVCDTSPGTVTSFLKCSIAEDDVKKVVVLTNGEKEYVQDLMEVFSKEFPDKEMIILDHFISSESFIEKLNKSNLLTAHFGDKFLNDNCFSFSAEKVLVSMARYHLERGRMHCASCDLGGSISADGQALI